MAAGGGKLVWCDIGGTPEGDGRICDWPNRSGLVASFGAAADRRRTSVMPQCGQLPFPLFLSNIEARLLSEID